VGVTNVNELLQFIIQVCQVLLSSLVVRDELLLPFQELLALLLQGLTLGSLVVDSREHQGVFIVVLVLRELLKEVFNGNQRELLVFVAAAS
jgi:hypothetical protein